MFYFASLTQNFSLSTLTLSKGSCKKKRTQTMSFYRERFYFIHFASFLKLCNFYLTHFPSCRRERRYKSKQPLAVVPKNAGKRYHIEKYAKFTDMQRRHFSKLIIDLTFRWKSKFIIHNVYTISISYNGYKNIAISLYLP